MLEDLYEERRRLFQRVMDGSASPEDVEALDDVRRRLDRREDEAHGEALRRLYQSMVNRYRADRK